MSWKGVKQTINIEGIKSWCDEMGIKNYTINSQCEIDVDDNVSLIYRDLTKIPIKFNRVRGYFSCSNNKLNTLEGSPNYVGDSFYCYNNQLISLEGYNGDLNKLYCNNKNKLVRKTKLKLIDQL